MPVKLLSCSGSPKCIAFGAMLPPSLAYPSGEPYLVGRFTEDSKCARCKKRTKFSPADYARIPVLTPEDFDAIAKAYRAPQIAELPSQDFVGAGLKRAEARDMYRASFRHVHEIEGMERPKEVEEKPREEPAPKPKSRRKAKS